MNSRLFIAAPEGRRSIVIVRMRHVKGWPMSALGPFPTESGGSRDVRFSNRPVGVKHFQAIRHCSVDVARRLALLYGIGTKAVPPWGPKTRRNNLYRGL